MKHIIQFSSFVSLLALAGTASAQGNNAATTIAADQPSQSETQDIIVTAQKRSERLQDAPLSINAASGAQLQSAGITNTDQLQKLVPGFTAEKTAFGNPVFFIRGIGFNDTTLGVSPAVSIYIDQQPLTYSPMARGAILDLERVEVLKGPQGTIFGQNSTGGAINYIAAKPTREVKAGFDLTYGRFNEVDAEAFLSAPIGETLSIRAAARKEYRDGWQTNYANGSTNGNTDFVNGRLSLKWEPMAAVSLLLTASGWRDRSDAQQPQLVQYTPLLTGPGANPVPFPIDTFPTAPRNPRAGSWGPNNDFRLDNWLYQFSGDLEADINDNLHLASLTSYARYHQRVPIDIDATIYPAAYSIGPGDIETFSQELRFNGKIGDAVAWMIGGNYKHDRVKETVIVDPLTTSGAALFGFPFSSFAIDNDQNVKSWGVFGSLDYHINEQFTLQGSARYTKEDRDYAGCSRDSGDGTLAASVSFLTGLLGNPQTVAPGGCVVLDNMANVQPIVRNQLNQDNVSFRTSLNWKPNRDTLVYANITKGYKSGSFPSLSGALLVQQFEPIGQESVLAYELGTKLALERKIQLSGAVFYYDYRDKQLLGTFVGAFGPLPALVSIPKTHVKGAELSLAFAPFSGLSLTLNGTHILTRVDRDPVNPTGPYGNPTSFVGHSFPLTPKWQGTADAQYRFPVSGALEAFVGTTITARTGTVSSLLSEDPAVAPLERLLEVPGYVLIDLRAGISSPDEQWRLEIWGRNVTNKYYSTGTSRIADFTTRFTGMPATFGATLKYRM
ncbi:TonB-dependent receptor [Flavisphingomonas formosensis]|uniref:TonB-dependent receptor n=1 Tax=Flavisphingomonas formosensis TaxID=861534 RepID=UPI0012FC6C0C|nr:TonB-dependent receptor [Sphingomonas formosensis]